METPKSSTSSRKRTRGPAEKPAKRSTSERSSKSRSNEADHGGETPATFKQSMYPYLSTGAFIRALADQRRREKESELYRDAVDIGMLFLAIEREPGSDGRYGTLAVEDLAKRIRPRVVMALDWLAQHGYPVQTGGSAQGLEALLGLFQHGLAATAPPVPTPPPAPVAADLTEVPDLMLSDHIETTLGIEEDGGFM